MHLGWLNAQQDKRNKSRIEEYGENDPICKMPECDKLVLWHLHELGFCSKGGMQVYPLTWSEIKAYSELSESRLTSWESAQVSNMSRLYCSYLSKAKDPSLPSPYQREFDEDDKAARAESMQAAMIAADKMFDDLDKPL